MIATMIYYAGVIQSLNIVVGLAILISLAAIVSFWILGYLQGNFKLNKGYLAIPVFLSLIWIFLPSERTLNAMAKSIELSDKAIVLTDKALERGDVLYDKSKEKILSMKDRIKDKINERTSKEPGP